MTNQERIRHYKDMARRGVISQTQCDRFTAKLGATSPAVAKSRTMAVNGSGRAVNPSPTLSKTGDSIEAIRADIVALQRHLSKANSPRVVAAPAPFESLAKYIRSRAK